MSQTSDPDALSPAPLLAMSGAYWRSSALHASVALDVFTPLAGGPAEAPDLALRLDCDPRALAMLLNALCPLGLLEKQGEAYALTPLAAAFLVRSAPRCIGHIIRHHRSLAESFTRLDEAVRSGRRVRGGVQRTETDREDFLMGMFNMAMGIAPGLAPQLDALLAAAGLPGMAGRTRLLDLGGGPGTYAIHFCLAHPGLRATVLDLPSTQPFAEATAARFDVADRVAFQPGDYTEQDIPGTYDLAWLSQVLHGEAPATAAAVVGKAAAALAPDGILLVHEFLLDDTLDGPEFPALFSLNMLLGTEGGQSYSWAQVEEMLSGAGLVDIRRLGFRGPNHSGIVAGRMKTT
jgi:SAM-dependent methyltransferase